MKIRKDQIIGDLVAQDYRAASVFRKYGIDFCCQGNRTIQAACEKKNLDNALVVNDLETILRSKAGNGHDYQSWPIDLLADYIEKTHHRYVEETTHEIKSYLDKLCRVHGDRHAELFEIHTHFNTGAGELAKHMKKEELVLFPYIRKLAKAKQDITNLEIPHFGTVQNPIQMMIHEHTAEGERFRKIDELSNHFTPPQDACSTYRVTFELLKEFEQDLHLHIHLENNILFPKVIDLENELFERY